MDADLVVEILREDPDLPLPAYRHPGDAGMDVRSAVNLVLEPLQRSLVPTGLRVAVPVGYEMQVRPRSGLALKHGLTVANAPGTVDAGYRGPVGILLINLGSASVTIHRGDRIAQLVFAPVSRALLRPVESLAPSPRGEGGFGSTGQP